MILFARNEICTDPSFYAMLESRTKEECSKLYKAKVAFPNLKVKTAEMLELEMIKQKQRQRQLGYLQGIGHLRSTKKQQRRKMSKSIRKAAEEAKEAQEE